MHIEYLPSGSPMCPLIRLCNFLPEEAEELRKYFERLAVGEVTTIPLHQMPNITAVDNLELTLCLREDDIGTRRVPGRLRAFELGLTAESFADLAELTRPFEEAEPTSAFQWLAENGEASLLLSPSGWW